MPTVVSPSPEIAIVIINGVYRVYTFNEYLRYNRFTVEWLAGVYDIDIDMIQI